MTLDEQRRQLDEALARQEDRQAIRERLSLVSAVIWTIGALLVYFLILEPRQVRPQWGMVAGLALLIPAALPWLAYPFLVASATRRPPSTQGPTGRDVSAQTGGDGQPE